MGWQISGKLTAWHHRLAADRITPFMDPVRFQLGGGRDGMVMAGTDVRGYDVPHQLVEQLYRDTGVRTNPLRGIGVTANKFATEAFMDEVARKRGADPLAFRPELLKGTPRAFAARHRRRKKIRARPRTPARRILCDQHRRTVAYSVPN